MRYRHRYGVFVGIILFAAIVFFSGRVIWDIRVEGNDRLDDAEVLEALREQGLRVGSLHARLDIDALENRVLLYSDDISWISVNIIGTVANVELREVEPFEEPPPAYAASNVVAARGGVIEWFEDIRGNVAVEIGDAVGEGDLLIGGLYAKEGKPAHYTCAEGKVFARTSRDFVVEIPLQYEQKRYTGRVFVEKYMIFFEKEVKFFANSGNSPMTCDTIDTVEYFQTWGETRLPVGIRTVRHYEYELVSTARDGEAAERMARDALAAQIADGIPEAMLVRKSTRTELTDTALTLQCYVECIENIARIEEIKIEGISG
jgi:similar to stage IV sporulation protein